jgi:hypothetical protein
MTTIDRLAEELDREPSFWWGRTDKDGWLVLDRRDERNFGEMRHLVRCRDWCEISVARAEFNSKQFIGYKSYLRGLAEGQVPPACEELLALFRAFRARKEERRPREKEQIWNGFDDPTRMFPVLHFLSVRKVRLFGIACCRRIEEFMDVVC